MNTKSFIIAFLGIVMMVMPVIAQSPQEVTLTVSSDGPTKEDAIKNALRSAIEQTFGAFVSANTTILNDELVKDEIVTVSNGSIKDYKEISGIKADNGRYFVTLSATVSLPNLITYAKNHGSECEFAGNTFGMEMKLFELQKENELKALYNLSDQIEAILPTMMRYELIVGEPKIATSVYGLGYSELLPYYPIGKDSRNYNNHEREQMICLKYNTNVKGSSDICEAKVDEKAKAFMQPFLEKNIKTTMNTFYEVPMTIKWVGASSKSQDEITAEVERLIAEYESKLDKKALKKFTSVNKKYTEYIGDRRRPVQNVMTPREHMVDSLTTVLFNRYNAGIPFIFFTTLESISLSNSISEEYSKKGIGPSKLVTAKNNIFYFRNSQELINKWISNLFERIGHQFNSFTIADNTGQKSDFFPQHILDKIQECFRYKEYKRKGIYGPNLLSDKVPVMLGSWVGDKCIFGTGLFYNFFNTNALELDRLFPEIESDFVQLKDIQDITENGIQGRTLFEANEKFEWKIKAYIPQGEIGRYSRFWIEKKDD